MRALVIGGRAYNDGSHVFAELDRIRAELSEPIDCVIEGGASGADFLAARWAKMRLISRRTFHADWSRGRRAGPERNQRMIQEGKPDLIVAFPGGRGTEDCVRRAEAAGVKVIRVEAGARP